MQKADVKEDSKLDKDCSVGILLDGRGRDCNRGFQGFKTSSVETGNTLSNQGQFS